MVKKNLKTKNIFCFIMAFCLIFTSFIMSACSPAKNNEQETEVYKQYDIDALNTTGISKWSSLPFVTAQAKAQGLVGGTACQHLNYITRAKNNKNILYFGTDACGMWKSVDGGNSWNPCSHGLYTKAVSGIETDPKNDNHVVVVNGCGSETTSVYSALMYSLDGGKTWSKSEGTRGMGFAGTQYFYNTLAFDESSYDETLGYCKDVYYCTVCERDSASKIKNDETYAAKKGMYKSTDGGKTFEKIEGTENLTDGIICIVNDKIAVANMNGIFVKSESGTFNQVSSMCVQSFQYVAGKYYILCAGDYQKGSTDEEKRPIITNDDGIYVSSDLTSFTKITDNNFPNRIPRNLCVSSKNENYMVMFARKKIDNRYAQRPYYSHDGGITWTLTEPQANDELFYNYTWHNGVFTFDPDNENVIVGIIGGEVIKSEDGGASFTYSGSGVNNVSVGGMLNFNVYNENLVYVGAYDFGGAFTSDGGNTWKNISLSKDGDGRDIMGGYAADENTLFGVYIDTWTDSYYFANYRYVCYSHDAGKTVNIDSSKVIKSKEYKNTTKTDIYENLKIDSSIGTSYESSYQSPTNRQVLFCANYRSSDGGYNWENMLNYEGEKCLQVFTHSKNVLYGCSKRSGYVLKSLDNGRSWEKVNSEELPVWEVWLKDSNGDSYKRAVSGPSHITDIAVDAKNGYIYACYYRRLIRMKLDGTDITILNDVNSSSGYTGMAKNNFNTFNVRSVAVDPNCPEIVYVCGSGDFYFDCESVRRSCNSGKTWQTLTPSSSQNSIVSDNYSLGYEGRCVRVRSNGEVWLSSLCLGCFKITPPYAYSK